MRIIHLLPFILPAALAIPAPASQAQTLLSAYSDLAASLLGNIAEGVRHFVHGPKQEVEKKVEQWVEDGRQFVRQNEIIYEVVSHPLFSEHKLRITEPTLCDPSVKQYSGYLDIAEDKHLFFWFFESRVSPDEAPLTMWLNGGPGCSSSTGLLFELGPCTILPEGKNTTRNPYSWNTHSNMIFLDQPVNTGYSYADDGTTVDTSPVVGQDVYAFLQLFFNRFHKYAHKPFHLAAESYGGTFGPHIASAIYQGNKAHSLSPTPSPHLKPIHLGSLILANGMTDSYVQFASIPEYLCSRPYPIYDDPEGPECVALKMKVPTCQRLINACRTWRSKLTCGPAVMYCYQQLYGPIQNSGLNPYDARIPCDRSTDGPFCYPQMRWVDAYLNSPAHKAELGVSSPGRKFESCNLAVNEAFMMSGDVIAANSGELLVELINGGVRLLVYAGNADMMCNYIGNERWVEALEHDFRHEFSNADSLPWVTIESGRVAGTVRSAGGHGKGAGNVTFVTVYEAGHMVPHNQPEAALDLFTRWIMDVPLTDLSR